MPKVEPSDQATIVDSTNSLEDASTCTEIGLQTQEDDVGKV
jgi:hypothetical protein